MADDDDRYILGYRQAEQERLQRQGEQLRADSARLFEEVGIAEGARVLDLGCGPRGCLELLAERVGPSGRVIGVEISMDAVSLAREWLAARQLDNVELICADARATGLPRSSFDVISSRLVLVNVPLPEEIVSEAIALARPGGTVAFHEVDWAALICEPPSEDWDVLLGLFLAVAEKNGSSYYVGRRLPRMLEVAGLTEVRVHPIMHFHPVGDPRRTLMLDFADNLQARIAALDLIRDDDFTALRDRLARHLEDPATAIFQGPYVQAWGRKLA